MKNINKKNYFSHLSLYLFPYVERREISIFHKNQINIQLSIPSFVETVSAKTHVFSFLFIHVIFSQKIVTVTSYNIYVYI